MAHLDTSSIPAAHSNNAHGVKINSNVKSTHLDYGRFSANTLIPYIDLSPKKGYIKDGLNLCIFLPAQRSFQGI